MTGSKGATQPFSITLSVDPKIKGGRKQRGHWERILKIKYRLLCKTCEERFSQYEDYFRKLFYGNTPGSLQKENVGKLVSAPFQVSTQKVCSVRVVQCDYKLLKLFILSLLWRISVADGHFVGGTSLGFSHERRLAQALLAEDPLDENEYPFLMTDLRDEIGDDLGQFIAQPGVHRDPDNCRVCRIVAGGFNFDVSILALGHIPPAIVQKFTLRQNGQMILIAADGTSRIVDLARRLKAANAIPAVL